MALDDNSNNGVRHPTSWDKRTRAQFHLEYTVTSSKYSKGMTSDSSVLVFYCRNHMETPNLHAYKTDYWEIGECIYKQCFNVMTKKIAFTASRL